MNIVQNILISDRIDRSKRTSVQSSGRISLTINIEKLSCKKTTELTGTKHNIIINMNQLVILSVVACIAILLPTAAGFLNPRQRQSRQSDTDLDANVSLDLSSILPFVSMIKSQVRDIVSELALQVFEYVRNIAQNFKVRLLKKLGKYTLSNVFHLLFDGVVDFVKDEAEASDKPNDTENVTESTTKKEVEDNESSNKEEPSGNFILDNTYPWAIYTQ